MKTDDNAKLFFSLAFEFLEVFLPKQAGRSKHTIKSYRDALSLFRRYLFEVLDVPIEKFAFQQCTRECVLGFLDFLSANGNAPTTRNQRLAAIKSYAKYCAERDVSLQSIALQINRIPQKKAPEPERFVLAGEAIYAILTQPPETRMGLRDRTLLVLMYDSAARLDEILSLTVGNLSLEGDNPHIRIIGKGSKERVISITDLSVQHLNVYLNNYSKDDPQTEFLFYTVIKGKAAKMSESNAERILRQYAAKAKETYPKIPDRVYPHMLRRARATHLYQDGVDISLVSRILGHANLETTQIYAIPSLNMIRKAMESVTPPNTKDETPEWTGCLQDNIAKLYGLR